MRGFAAELAHAAATEAPDPDKGPLLQKLLYACALKCGATTKEKPFAFDWKQVSAAALEKHERRRQQKRGQSGRGSDEARARAARVQAIKRKEKNAAYHKEWRKGETGQRAEAHTIERNHALDVRSMKTARWFIADPAVLRQGEEPAYIVESPGHPRAVEIWPPRDLAAAFIRATELREQLNAVIAVSRRLLLKPVESRRTPKAESVQKNMDTTHEVA